jgi:hypothetical protein
MREQRQLWRTIQPFFYGAVGLGMLGLWFYGWLAHDEPQMHRPEEDAVDERAAIVGAVHSIAPNVWRWEIRFSGALVQCGTAASKVAAEMHVHAVVDA